ncbi:MAG: hypothetical protein IPP49_07175 [Saprospiraceae bacterium]|nr:hypothetical protein [Saprospiraceae bacterium]
MSGRNIAISTANYENLKLETDANAVRITEQEQKVKLAELSDRKSWSLGNKSIIYRNSQ